VTPFGLRFQWVAATLFWAFISILLCAQIWWIAQQPGESIAVRRTLIWQATFYLAWIPLTVAIWQAVARWRAEDRGRAVVIVTHLLACLLIGMVHTVVVVVIASVLAPSPTEPVGVQMLVGQFRGRIYIQLVIYAGVVASGHAFAMYGRWREQTDRASRLEAQLAESRLSALRAQLHPHLLFNSLHAVASLVRESRNPEAVKLIADLGQLLRTVLDNHRVWHTVAEELALVRTFLDIQRVRFEDRLITSVEVDPDANTALVPVLLIQPLVENSLRHGLAGKVGVGHVHVVVRHTQDRLTVQVDDDGVGGVNTLTSGDPGTGLVNLRARLETLFGGEATLTAGPRDEGGFRVLIGMPHRRT
jgi:two-component system LytT family sensor kinase